MDIQTDQKNFIEEMYAKDGFVHAISKDGDKKSLSVEDAAHYAQEMNRINMPEWHRKRHLDFLDRFIQVIREAKQQRIDISKSDNSRDQEVKRFINQSQGFIEEQDEGVKKIIDDYIDKYEPTIAADETITVIKNHTTNGYINFDQAKQMLDIVYSSRVAKSNEIEENPELAKG